MLKTPWAPFWKSFPWLTLLPLVVLTLVYHERMAAFHATLEREGQLTVDAQVDVIRGKFDQVTAIVQFLSQQNELIDFIASGDRAWLPRIAQEYLALSRHARIYDQIRYLDEQGREMVRVNYNDGQPAIIPESGLQDKSDRYYFKDTMTRDVGQIYVSPLDLNIENGVVERPFKPMVRIGAPVFDRQGQKRGIVIVNFLAQTMLAALERAGKNALSDPMLLNSEGYWLLSPNPPPSWGFMFPDQSGIRMQTLYPGAWAAMRQAFSGQVATNQGLFFFQRVDPLADPASSDVPPTDSSGSPIIPHWWVVSYVAKSRIDVVRRNTLAWLIAVGVVIVILLAVGTRAISIALLQRQRHRAHLEHLALVDILTGIPNRAAFEERLELEFERAQRHGRRLALIYIDLDGFKTINDSQGHQAGDQVLKDVAACLARHCRREDAVGRYGGDEFAMLLAEPPDIVTTLQIAEKARQRIAALRWKEQSISASLGVALYPDHAVNLLELIRVADAAMYASKTSGKNRIALASDT